MSGLPTRTDLSGTPTKATAQSAFTALYDFIAQRFAAGTSGAGTASAAELKAARDSMGINMSQLQSISASVASNALTAGMAATTIDIRSATLTTGAPNTYTTGALSLVAPSGASLGSISGAISRIAILAIDASGVVELAFKNVSLENNLSETGLISTTAISAGSTSSSVFYSTTARTNVAYRVAGFLEAVFTTGVGWSSPTLVQGAGGQSLTKVLSPIQLGTTQATTSGTFKDFAIPAGVKRVTAMLNAVSLSGGAELFLQLSDSGVVRTSGYSGYSSYQQGGGGAQLNSTSFRFYGTAGAANANTGIAVLENMGGNTWVISAWASSDSGSWVTANISGAKTLSGALDLVRFTSSNGTDTFDLGSLNVSWEF